MPMGATDLCKIGAIGSTPMRSTFVVTEVYVVGTPACEAGRMSSTLLGCPWVEDELDCEMVFTNQSYSRRVRWADRV